MPKNDITPINAGSMADIAFLLLIFFLVTTTMNVDEGLLQILPRMDETEEPPQEIAAEKVFSIKLAQDALMVEGELADLDRLRHDLYVFMTNGGIFEDRSADPRHVSRQWSDRIRIEAKISDLEESSSPSSPFKKRGEIAKLEAHALFGEFKEMPSKAVIHIECASDTDYGQYILVNDAVRQTINTLRDELCSRYTTKDFMDLDQRNSEERRLIRAVRAIYPERVVESTPPRERAER